MDINSWTILICEDDRNLRQLIRAVLGDGYRLVEAADGWEGVKLARELQPDLVILDLMLPRLSGLEVLERILGDPDPDRPRIIVMSAWADAEEAALRAGADRFVPKPFEVDELSMVVEEALNSS